MVKSREEDEDSNNDDRDGSIWMLWREKQQKWHFEIIKLLGKEMKNCHLKIRKYSPVLFNY